MSIRRIVKAKGRLQPGRMFLVDFEQGELIPDEELKQDFASPPPVRRVARSSSGSTSTICSPDEEPHGFDADTLLERMQAFGYTIETMHFMLLPMIQAEKDPIGSMGNDSCLACLSDKPRMLYDYFRQLFAQVTNPAIDSIREEVDHVAGVLHRPRAEPARNDRGARPSAAACRTRFCRTSRWRRSSTSNDRGWKTQTIDITWPTETPAKLA